MKKKIIIPILIAIILIPVIGFAYISISASHPELIDGRFRTYKQFYESIQVGDSKSEVMNKINLHYPEGGKRQSPTVWENTKQSLGFFMNPEKWKEPNCEGILLTLEDGKVVTKEYSKD